MIARLGQKLLTLNNRHFFFLDAIVFSITPLLSIILRLDGFTALEEYKYGLIIATLLSLIVKLTIFSSLGFYKRYWRYASIDELLQIACLTVAAVIVETIILSILQYFISSPNYLVPRSLPLLDGILSLVLVGGIRFSIRATERASQNKRKFTKRDRILIVGAGDAGVSLLHEIQRNPKLGLEPVAFLDDDPSKLNLKIRGIVVVGNRYDLPEVVSTYNIRQVIIAMPTASGQIIREIVDICQALGVKTSTLPGIQEILNHPSHQIKVNSVRDINIEDLLRREPIQTDAEKVFQFLAGKKVLVTGAGGSIGSELCRQIFRCRPATIILVGHGENSVFNIQQELEQILQILRQEPKNSKPIPILIPFIADLRFKSRLEQAFRKFKPDIVFHAAAHKHVPLMELNQSEAITNNVVGTKNLLDLAIEYQVQNFVMISTDKAVNPTNVMGASKRVAEMLVLKAAQTSGKPFVVVRFGNVLGSRGSVVPTFQKQIAKGGPITITHPEICRYFMTIPEAVQLVLQAAVLSRQGQIFMLNMGKPVKIVDLAKDLIRLSGYEVGKDIEIIFTGLRPGEKLYEELLIPGEEYEQTQHQKLLIVKNANEMIPENLDLAIARLCQAATKHDGSLILFLLEQVVSGYKPNYLPEQEPKHNNRTQFSLINSSETLAEINNKILTIANFNRLKTQDLEQALQQVINRQELRLYYQPIVNLATGQICEFEALIRWHHPQWGELTPIKFLPLAEASGSLIPITEWVIKEVCRQLYTWQKEFPNQQFWSVSINIPSIQILQPNLIRHIKSCLKQYDLKPQSLKLEISENVLRENPYSAMGIVSQLHNIGIQLQIDNFGRICPLYNQLHSNLLYKQFNRIKIDRFLINRIDKDLESFEIVSSIASNINNFGLEIVATGIETKMQLQQLGEINCSHGQGYFFSRPMTVQQLPKLLLENLIPSL
ncbi:polysaccharide biosynthesis protein CapD [Stanieria cyanosphaera PCC 7437]|uniref:Polysaccharide biosynthesis protein CapD n=1 Tax=Stanieria cyanosphaera (strain ATCC 29371 / PCC 7437) TaxID=111780 RepID=K9XZT7_STAC7|nr:polysaccharide biosynthesis protein [Stanieria cyanosphaera]AFZ37636.1 polysaccharide biosynthesis protein CapD [Stanieria cyanosphaera PCC 7437]